MWSFVSVNAAGNSVNLSFCATHYYRGSFRKWRPLGNNANSLTLKDVLRAISCVFTNHRKAFHALSFPLVELLSLDQIKYNLSDRNTLLSQPLEKSCLLELRWDELCSSVQCIKRSFFKILGLSNIIVKCFLYINTEKKKKNTVYIRITSWPTNLHEYTVKSF